MGLVLHVQLFGMNGLQVLGIQGDGDCGCDQGGGDHVVQGPQVFGLQEVVNVIDKGGGEHDGGWRSWRGFGWEMVSE